MRNTRMTAPTPEREWLQRFQGEKHHTQSQGNTAKANGKSTSVSTSKNGGNGFADVAGMSQLKELVIEGFINVLRNKDCAEAYGIKPPSLLFYGPAGCGKTFFAEKIAEELGIHFMKIVPDDLACTWIHGTQQKIGELFREAEKKAPTLMFFDEFDAMVPKRSENDANQAYNGEVNEFLCMLNKANERGVYVLAATNHPERIDKAVLRTGRIDEMIYVDMPDKEARESLFRLSLSKLPIASDIDYDKLASLTEGYNCSDIDYIVKSAARKMFNATIKQADYDYEKISQLLLEETIARKSPSVSAKDIREYERVRSEFSPKDEKKKDVRIGFHV